MTDELERACPACDTAALGEWDDVLRVYHCPTCSTTWRRRPGRHVPTLSPQPRLPGLHAMTLETELPPPTTKGRR
jgi:hypothetical protein